MKNFIIKTIAQVSLILLLLSCSVFAQQSGGSNYPTGNGIRVKEVDSAPNAVGITTLVFPNGSLTRAGQTMTVTFGGAATGVTIGTTTIISGTAGRVLYETSGNLLGEISTLTSDGTIVTASGPFRLTTNGALSSGNGPAFQLNGTWITGGSATTTKPYVLIETTGATSTGWSTSGTGLGINAASGFTGRLLELQVNGVSRAYVTGSGYVASTTGFLGDTGSVATLLFQTSLGSFRLASASAAIQFHATNANLGYDLTLRRAGAANLALGDTNAAVPVNQAITTQGSRGGTDSNTAGADLTIQSGIGTGTATPSSLILQSTIPAASGTTAQTSTTGLTILNGTAKLSSYTVATLPSASISGAGALAFITDESVFTAATGIGLAPTGGGSTKVIVYSDGTNWLIL